MGGRKSAGAVAAGHRLVAEAAADVLREGGNAVDATIAGLWMACVCEPVLASVGGGGFMLIVPPGKPGRLLDFFVQTPQRKPDPGELAFSQIDADFGAATQAFHVDAGSSATPGYAQGLFAAHEVFSEFPMKRLLQPAIDCAKAGHTISPFQAEVARVVTPILLYSEAARQLFAPSGKLPLPGVSFANPQLADALDAIAAEGVRIASEGEIAQAMVRSCSNGGLLTHRDFAAYQAQWRAPLLSSYDGHDLLLNPPPSCGGVLIADMLRRLDRIRGPKSPLHIAPAIDETDRLWREAEGSLVRFAAQLDRAQTRQRGTTHISVIDAAGLAVAATVSNGEGNGLIVPGCGFMLNNMLGEDDLVPQGVHRWTPDTRLSSMMAPSVVRTARGLVVALGSGGSNRIRSAVLQCLLSLTSDASDDLAGLIEAPRLHVENNHLDFEDFFPGAIRAALIAQFPDHRAWDVPNMFFGGVHAVRRTLNGTLQAAGDPRREGYAIIV